MNVFLVYDDGTLVTPELNGSILEGVTRRRSSSSRRSSATRSTSAG